MAKDFWEGMRGGAEAKKRKSHANPGLDATPKSKSSSNRKKAMAKAKRAETAVKGFELPKKVEGGHHLD